MMMLRKIVKPHQKDQHVNSSTFGYSPKSFKADSEESPTSPFDIGILASNVFRKPRSESEGKYQKRWKCGELSLGLVYALDDGVEADGNILHAASLKTISPLVIEELKPANVRAEESKVIFEIEEALLVPDMRPLNIGTDYAGSVLPDDLELSEDYTRVIVHGSIPKITHIFGDHILGQENGFQTNFLNNCYACQKKLDGEDIYMYRGEKAFCSDNCRAKEIEIDEEMEKNEI